MIQSHMGIGIDVGGTKTWAILGGADGKIKEERKVSTPKDRGEFLGMLNEIIGRWMQDRQSSSAPIRGIGIGLPGRVSGGIVRWVPNLPELDGFPLSEVLERQWKVPVRLQNDGKLALLGEQWLGAASGCRHVMMMVIGTGIGGGIMIDGSLLEGAHGTAGSLGWMTLDLNDAGNKQHGWLERMVSGTAIHERAGRLSMDGWQLFVEARNGSPEAVQLVNEIGHCIGTSIATAVSILDLERVVIGGGLSSQLPQLLDAIQSAVTRFASPSTRDVTIVPAKLADRAGVLGALRLALQ